MFKLATRIIAFLLLGAISNIAVAWGIGMNARPPVGAADQALSPQELDPLWNFHLMDEHRAGFSGWRERQLLRTVTVVGDCYIVTADGALVGIDNAMRSDLLIVESGFPCRSLKHAAGGWFFSSWMPQPTPSLRHAVIWMREAAILASGFAVNTMFYAAILWLMFAAPFALRRRRRIRHGLCPACAYPIGESDVCTECGTPLSLSEKK